MANDEYGYFWNSNEHDRVYDADSFSNWLRKFFTAGVFQNDLQVTANGGLTIKVGTGYANIHGKVRFFDSETTFQITRPDGIVNATQTARSSLAMGLAYYYQRAAVAVTTTDFTAVALTLQDQRGKIIKNELFATQYVPPVPEEEENGMD